MDIKALRENYTKSTLSESDVSPNPFDQFDKWFKEAVESQCKEPNAMTLATVDALNQPNARIVLLKEYANKGFIFYTNYESEKAIEMDQQPHAALVFNWFELQRQVRIRGVVEKVSRETSAQYFRTRPRGSQIGAHASAQSQIIPDRQHLDEREKRFQDKFQGQEVIPLPGNWGGYRVNPSSFEFWQGRSSRLHDRIAYVLKNKEWELNRLAP